MITPVEYPLAWPEKLPRPRQTEKSRFSTSLTGALNNVHSGLRMLLTELGEKTPTMLISSNVTLGNPKPTDPGVSIWFQLAGHWMAMACARYHTPAENLQAIFHVIEARRTELRHVGIEMVRATFAGLAALPSPTTHTPLVRSARLLTRSRSDGD